MIPEKTKKIIFDGKKNNIPNGVVLTSNQKYIQKNKF